MKAKRAARRKSSSNSLTSRQIIAQLQKHHDVLQKQFAVKKIGLFGSYAAGRQTKKSDVDFVVEFEEPTFDNFMGLIAFLEKLFGKKVDVLTPEGVESIRVRSVAEEIQRKTVYV
jgi:predicted nucleotidyltransferase